MTLDDPLKIDAVYPLFVSNVTPEGFSIAIDPDADVVFGYTSDQSVYLGAVLAIPTCLVSGPPTWVPAYIGAIWWSNVDQILYVWDGTAWIAVTGGAMATGRAWEHYRHYAAASAFDGEEFWFMVSNHVDCQRFPASVAADILFAQPWISPTGGTLEKIAIQVDGGIDSPSKAIMAVYETDSNFTVNDQYPTNRVLLTEELTVIWATPAIIQFVNDNNNDPISLVLSPQKLYWFAFSRESNGGDANVQQTTVLGGNAADVLGYAIGGGGVSFTSTRTFIYKDRTYDSTLPDPFPDNAIPAQNDQAFPSQPSHLCIWIHYYET